MRKSNIKSIYHWSIMGLVMGMPLIITACSYIPNAYNENHLIKYETYVPVESLVSGKRYHIELNNPLSDSGNKYLYYSDIGNLKTNIVPTANTEEYHFVYTSNAMTYLFESLDTYSGFVGSFDFTFVSGDASFYLPYITEYVEKEVVNNGAYQVWQYNKQLLDLPINQWYSSLLDLTIGKPSEFTPLSNVVVFPLYAIWVLIFDLAFDVLAFIPKLAHNWCDKLGGEEE